MSDLIDRQAAIDTLEEGFKDVTRGVEKLSPTYGLIEAVTGIYKCLIGKLPSAEPDIVRCKDCKYWKRSSCCEGYCGEIDMEGFDEDHYCGFAERKQDG